MQATKIGDLYCQLLDAMQSLASRDRRVKLSRHFCHPPIPRLMIAMQMRLHSFLPLRHMGELHTSV